MILKYKVDVNHISFWCNGLDEDDSLLANIFDDFLSNFYRNRNVILHGYKMWDELDPRFIDKSTVLAEARDLLQPSNIYWKIKEVRTASNYFCDSCEVALFCCEDNVKWEDFLATSDKNKPKKLIKQGFLLSYFISGDHGADYWFECSRNHENKIFELFEQLSNSGYEVKRVLHL